MNMWKDSEAKGLIKLKDNAPTNLVLFPQLNVDLTLKNYSNQLLCNNIFNKFYLIQLFFFFLLILIKIKLGF